MDQQERRQSIFRELHSALKGGADFELEVLHTAGILARRLLLDVVMVFDLAEGRDAVQQLIASIGVSEQASSRLCLPAAMSASLQSAPPEGCSIDENAAVALLPGVDFARGEARVFPMHAGTVLSGALLVVRQKGLLGAFELDVFLSLALQLGSLFGHRSNRERQQRAIMELSSRNELMSRMLAEESVKGALLDAALDAIVIADHQGCLLEFNLAAETMFGFRRKDVIGRPMADVFVPQASRSAHLQGMARYLATGVPRILGRRIELMAQRANGPDFLAEVSIVRIAGTEPPQFAAFLRDIDEPKRTEAHLRNERKLSEAMFEFAPEANMVVTEKGNILLANSAAEKLFGATREELLLSRLDDLLPGSNQDLSSANLGYSGRSTSRRPERFAVTSAGQRIPIEVDMNPYEFEDGHRVVLVIRNISAQLKALTDLGLLESQLRQSQKMQSLGTLAGGVAHYFNNVLAAIMANVELMRDLIPVVDPLRENLDMIRAASVRGSELVKQVLSFSRQKPGSREVIRLDRVVVEVVQLLRVTIPAGIQIIMRLSAGAPCVLADSTQIHQVLLNLVTNAWHAIEGPVGRITIGLETCVVTAQHESGLAMLPGSYAQISVTDDGRGMSEATLVRIFDPFFTTKNIGEGTGLGLSEVHGIVADHGGIVDVKSTLGRGSSFTIYLPGTGQPLVVADPETREVQSGSGRILLLDDESSLVRIGKVLLERLGYKVAGFVEPEAALAAFRSAPGEFDIIVTDQNMPRISGLEVARAMRKLRPELPIVLVSGNGLLIGSEDSIADPLYRLSKPYTRGALSAILRKALCRD